MVISDHGWSVTAEEKTLPPWLKLFILCKNHYPQTKRKNIYCCLKYSGGATGSCDLAERDTGRNKYRHKEILYQSQLMR